MKRFSLVQMVVILIAVITLASCGMTQPIYEDGYERQPSRRVYADPYYGNQTVLVRDPYTGQYYEVVPVNPYGGYGYGYPNTYPNSRYYGNNYGRGYSRGYSRNNPPVNQNRGSNSGSTSNKGSEKIDRAKDIINGKN